MKVFKIALIVLFFCFLFKPSTVFSETYKAFSLKNAQKMIMNNTIGADFRETMPQVLTLAGITRPSGLVYDSEGHDIIIVGTEDSRFPVLTIDDFISALKAKLVLRQWPLVSLEPDDNTDRDNQLIVRFKGGLADTSFGKYLLEADYEFKKMVLGTHSIKADGFKSYWEIGMEMVKKNPETLRNIKSGLWFFPLIGDVIIEEDVVEIGRVDLKVFSESGYRSVYHKIHGGKEGDVEDKSAIEFSASLNSKFQELADKYPVFTRLYALSCFVALATAIEDLKKEAIVSWWLNNYNVKTVETPSRIKMLKREEKYEFEKDGFLHKGNRRLSGGIRLVAITRHIKGGNSGFLKDKVLQSRPTPETLSWSFLVNKWHISSK